jgi:hypothetical protein
MRRHHILSLFFLTALAGWGQTYTNPAAYPGGTTSSANPGQITYYFQSNSPQSVVNTSSSAIPPCTANCIQWVSGDQFSTTWSTGIGAGSGGNIYLGGGVGIVNASGTPATVNWVSGTPFNTSWFGTTITIAGVQYIINSCASTTVCTLTTGIGTLTGAGYAVTNAAYGVATWNSATVATLMSPPGTQSGVTMINRTACKPISALDFGSGCQNSVSHDPTLPGGVTPSLITQITDQATIPGISMAGSPSGGDNDHVGSRPNGTYFWETTTEGTSFPLQLTVTGSPAHIQVVNSSAACPGYVMPQVGAILSTGWLSDTRYYYVSGTQVYQADLTGSGCTLALGTPNLLVDVEAAGVCPGIPSGLHIGSIFGVGGDGTGTAVGDDTFTFALIPGGQGSGDWVVSWSRTKGCAAANFHTGLGWGFCKAPTACNSSTPPLGTMASGPTNCWGLDGSTSQGIHNVQTDGLGLYAFISADMTPGTVPTHGGCSGISLNAVLIEWQIGTLGNVWAGSLPNPGTGNGGAPFFNIGNHQSVGITNIVSNQTPKYAYSPINNISVFTEYRPNITSNGLNLEDQHEGLPSLCTGSYSDIPCAFIGASDTVLNTQLSGCTGSGAFIAAVYCPTAYSNMVIAMFPFGGFPSPVLSFAHTGSCGGVGNGCADQIPDKFGSLDAIGVPSAIGDKFCWASSMWHQLGNDLNLAPATEAFCIYFGPGSFPLPVPVAPIPWYFAMLEVFKCLFWVQQQRLLPSLI